MNVQSIKIVIWYIIALLFVHIVTFHYSSSFSIFPFEYSTNVAVFSLLLFYFGVFFLNSPILSCLLIFCAWLSEYVIMSMLSMLYYDVNLILIQNIIISILSTPIYIALILLNIFPAYYLKYFIIRDKGDMLSVYVKSIRSRELFRNIFASVSSNNKLIFLNIIVGLFLSGVIVYKLNIHSLYAVMYFTGTLIYLFTCFLLIGCNPSKSSIWSFIFSFSSWIGVPIIFSLLLYSIRPVGVHLFKTEKRTISRGIVLGDIQATLTFGIPSNIWSKVPIRYPRIPYDVWYWRTSVGKYTLDVRRQVNPHILIVGGSGTGKSSLAKHLVKEFLATYGIPSLIIDAHNEYIDLAQSINGEVVYANEISINPLDLDGASPRERIVQVADTLQRVFRLGNLQRVTLEEILEEAYSRYGIEEDLPETWSKKVPTSTTLLRIIEERIGEAKNASERGRYESLKPYIRLLATSVFLETSIPLSKILNKPCVIALAKVPGDQIKAIVTEVLLRKIAHYMYLKGFSKSDLGVERYIVIDEAHRVIKKGSSGPSLVGRLIMESRKYGIGFIIITQQPLDLDEAIIANTAVKISFNISEPKNLDYIAKCISGYMQASRVDMIKQAIYYLPRGFSIVRDSLIEPSIIKVKC